MAYTTINKSSVHYDTNLYQANGSGKTISGMEFQPDWIWTSNRSSASYEPALVDSVRGGTKKLFSARTDTESTDSNAVTSFTSDGYVFGSSGSFNYSTDHYVNWCWKAGTTGSGNTTGSGTAKTYNYSVNTTGGFSIVKYVGNGSTGQEIPHHLGAVPHLIFLKPLDASDHWRVYHHQLHSSAPEEYFLRLQTTGTRGDSNDIWSDTAPTSSVFTVGNNSGVNANDQNFIAYVFTEKTGYSKFGTYKGNGQSDGTFIYTGHKPEWIMIKRTDSADWWGVFDSKRNGYNGANYHDRINEQSYAETIKEIDILSNGFKMRTTDTAINASGGNYIYMSFGQSLVGSNNVPCTAR
tara:strand:+ start:1370 stop:2422 length:1053 start_codon:yes stop_codon:yes gene_type:complete